MSKIIHHCPSCEQYFRKKDTVRAGSTMFTHTVEVRITKEEALARKLRGEVFNSLGLCDTCKRIEDSLHADSSYAKR